MNPEIQIAYFRRCLVETMTWCELTRLGPPLNRFRSPELNPGGSLDPAHYSFPLVESVCRRRAELLKKRKAPLLHDLGKAGQLLVFCPGLSLFDGAAELSSDGYFNANNEPPWDTWVYFGETPESLEPEDYRFFLLSWVPYSYLSITQRGIDANPEGCVEWLSTTAHTIPKTVPQQPFEILNRDLS
jgi:hypothetical protein